MKKEMKLYIKILQKDLDENYITLVHVKIIPEKPKQEKLTYVPDYTEKYVPWLYR